MALVKLFTKTDKGYKEVFNTGNHDLYLRKYDDSYEFIIKYNDLAYNSVDNTIDIYFGSDLGKRKYLNMPKLDGECMWNAESLDNMAHDYPELYQQLGYIYNVLMKKYLAIQEITINKTEIIYKQYKDNGSNSIWSSRHITQFNYEDSFYISFRNSSKCLIELDEDMEKELAKKLIQKGLGMHNDVKSMIISILDYIDEKIIEIITRPEAIQLIKSASLIF